MKTNIFHTVLFALASIGGIFAQDVTTVRAKSDISDNLDLKAVASIFGDSRDLEDFERRLNDPDIQISNLDLNGDNRVDYLRVIEATEGNTHLIILQSVLGVDTFQDVATIEVERDRNNNVQVQVVGDVYMYGANYIYEPVYVTRPVLFDIFWVSSYRPYYSPWYWGYYPRYYSYWAPYPIYRYRNNCHVHINSRNSYHYVDTRRSTRAVAMYSGRRSNAYERENPGRGFSSRNNGASNRYALEQSRGGSRSQNASYSTGSSRSSFTSSSSRSTSTGTSRNTSVNTVRSSGNNNSVRSSSPSRQASTSTRSNSATVRTSGTPSRSSNSTTVRSAGTTPARSQATPARNNSSIERNNTPAVRTQSAPSRSSQSVSPSRGSGSSVRSTPAASRQSSSAPSRSGGSQGGRSRG